VVLIIKAKTNFTGAPGAFLRRIIHVANYKFGALHIETFGN
jgi:hypothetical protein